MKVIVCTIPVYKFKGWLFEYKPHIGPWPLKKDGEPRLKCGNRFYDMFTEFYDLSEKEKNTHRISGGCCNN
jgi:hypothetical protein